VKVCSLYGDGFYYIPGTQTCLKFGGFLRTEWDANAGGSFTPFFSTNGLQTRGNDTLTTRARGVLTADVREQSSFGTLRAYIAAGWQQTSNDNPTLSLPGNTVGTAGGAATPVGGNNSSTYLLRAFIQFGGFTFGKTASFYDFINTSKYSHQTEFLYKDYAGDGVFTYGYTQQLGAGIAATIAVQDYTPFAHPVLDVSRVTASTFVGDNPFQIGPGGPTNSGNTNAGFLVPDIVGSIRVDQTWGGAQVAAILHDNRSSAYLLGGTPALPINGIIDTTAHPSDQWGFAVQGGLELNLANWGWAKGDSFAVQSQYCVGDVDSCINTPGSRNADLDWARKRGGNIGLAWADNAFFANSTVGGSLQTGLQLSTAWNIYAAIQHYWVPEIRTSLYGGYAQYQANSSAVDANFCAPLHAGGSLTTVAGGGTITGSSAVSASGCADWAFWAIGSRTIWNPVRNLDVGVDVLYSQLTKSAFSGATIFFPSPTQAAGERLTAGSSNIVAGILRVQYNFYP
jgi:Porin subfamily